MSSSDTQLEVWCAGEEWCPVTSTSTVLSGKWNPVIVHRLLNHGACGFNELKEAVDGISSKVLSDTLETLEGYGIVDREIVSEKPFRVRYSLTERGRSLEPVIREMETWGTEHLTEGERSD
jgi:DNA-binding HxlR family transcriptional regulator